MTDSKVRFTGLADMYAKARPSYPQAALEFIVSRCALERGDLLVDVGCGTGISSRLFADMGFKVVGIEPNADMRKKAQAQSVDGDLTFCNGEAENTGLAAGSAKAVLAAQAFHWFDGPKALAEFKRILKPGGWLILIWNERDETNAATKGYGDALRELPGAANFEMKRGSAGDPLLASPLFINAGKTLFPNSQILDRDGFLRRAFSASYVPQGGDAAERLKMRLEEVFAQSNKEGKVEMLYTTSVYLAQKQQ